MATRSRRRRPCEGRPELVDTHGDDVPDTVFSVVIATVETVRLDPTATTAELEAQKDILEVVNLAAG